MKAQKPEKSERDVWLSRLVVVSLGLCMLASLIGSLASKSIAVRNTDNYL